ALVWLKDPDGNYLACNKRFEQFFNASAADIIGKSDNDFVDEATAAMFRYNDQLALRSEHALINEEWIQFQSDQHKELVETTKVRLETDTGQLVGVLGVAYDITDRFKLHKQQKIGLSVFSEAIEGIMITDP
ncbi:PAS domain-containing protein, partial [Weissella cibaria]|uniref:PAS domain-containing protein n=1 Tax=Weissella cibaria TaxID=137591 RepID=UPI00215B539B